MMGLRAIQSVLFLSIYLYIYTFVALFEKCLPVSSCKVKLTGRQVQAGRQVVVWRQLAGPPPHWRSRLTWLTSKAPSVCFPFPYKCSKGTDEMLGHSRTLSYKWLWTAREWHVGLLISFNTDTISPDWLFNFNIMQPCGVVVVILEWWWQ